MKILKPIIAAAFVSGLLGMFLAIAALESGILNGATYWALVFSCGILSGGAIMAAKVAYDYEERRTSRVHHKRAHARHNAVSERYEP
jgi:hypothetical protein